MPMKKKNTWKNVFVAIFLPVLIFLLLTFPVSAATTLSVLDDQISIEGEFTSKNGWGNTGSISVDNDVITATAEGGQTAQATLVLKIKNNTSKAATITVDYSASNYSSFSEGAATGTKSIDLAPNETRDLMTIVGKKAWSSNTANLTLSNFTYTAAAEKSNVTFEYSGGSIIVGGNVMANGGKTDISSTDGATLVATPNSGYTFLGWLNGSTHELLSTSANYKLVPAKDMTVIAAFTSATSSAWFSVDNCYFNDLNAAATYATTTASKKVVLAANGTLPAGNYTIPSGVTLLIPFDDANTLYTTTPAEYGTTYVKPTVYRKLTMANGANITVNGSISLSAKVKTGQASKLAGGPSGPCSFIYMNQGSSITLNSGGALYAWGFVYGSGTVHAKSGAKVYECFQFTDFRGGSQTTEMTNEVFPISQYYVQNIEVPMTVDAGASVKAVTCFTVSLIGTQQPTVNFIGSSDSLFTLTDGSVTKYYDGTTDRTVVEINGTASLSPISLKVSISSINSNDYIMPLNSNITIKVKSGSNVTINQDIALLPGAQVVVDSGATCTLGSEIRLFVYDADQWGNFCASANQPFIAVDYAPGRTYTRTSADLTDAYVLINGTVDASAGYLYTTAGGANIKSTGSGIVKLKAGTQTKTYQLVQGTGYTEIPITPAKLKNADGTYFDKTANAKAAHTFIYKDGAWGCEEHTEGDSCAVCGHISCEHEEVVDAAKAPTCTETGLTEGKHCSKCNKVTVAQEEVAALGHTEVIDAAVAATCTTAGKTEGKHCSKCNEVLAAQGTVDALGHTEETLAGKAATCTETGLTEGKKCKVCGETTVAQQEIPAKGHTKEAVAGKDATCTATGLTAGEKCSVCGEVTVKQEVIPALGHTEETIAGKAATCTETGLKDGAKCSVCGVTITAQEVIPAAGHSYNDEWEVITEATESQAGEKRRDCKNCDAYETAVIPQLDHNCSIWPEVTLEAKAPTCTETGLTAGSKCSKCDAPIVAQEVIPALGHTTETLAGKAATCTETGLTEGKKCTVCGETTVAQEEIKALGHTEETVAGKAATCTEKGLTDGKKCTVCGETTVAQEEIPAKGHTKETIPGKAASCLGTGLTDGEKCSDCGEILTAQETIPATGHTEETVKGKDATCTETGLTDGVKCSVCGQTITAQETISAKGHTKETVKGKNATCTETGLTAGEKCSVCGEILTAQEVIPAKGHTEVIDAAEDATCTENGKTEGKHCSVCGEVLVAQEDVPAPGHTEVVDAAVPATCTQPGKTEGKHCSVCNAVIVAQETIPYPGHNHEAVVTKPTCTDDGFTTYTCSVCGDTYTADRESATGHAYDDGEVTTEAKGCDDGVMTFTCGNCGDSYTEPIDAPHFPFEGACSQCGVELCSHECEQDEILAKDATCAEAGATAGEKCSNCGKVTKKPEVIPATGHSYSPEVTKDVTCTENGVQTFTCENCDDSYTEDIPAPGHTIVTDEAIEPTCSSVGLTQGSHCGVCGEVFVAQGTVPKLKHTDKEPSPDHICDVCEITIGIHKAYSGTHDCAYCGKPASECADSDGDMACDVCGKDVSVAITFVGYYGSTTKYFGVGESIEFPEPLTESYSFELEFLGWKDASTGNLVTEETAVATATTTYTATYKVIGFKTDSIQLSVEYGAKNPTDEANGIIMYATLFVYVDANSSLGAPIIKLVEIDPETGEAKKESSVDEIFEFTDPQGRQTIYMYRLAFTAEDIADNNTFISIGVGDYERLINKVLFKYADSLSGIIGDGENTEAVMAAQQKLIDGMIRYGGAVQDCFYGDSSDYNEQNKRLVATSKILESFDKLGDERKDRDAADSIITTNFAAATGVFDTKISLQYYYNVTLNVQNAENVQIGVIVADTEEELTKLSGDFESATKSTAMFYTSEIKQVKDEQGQEKQYYVSTTGGMTINEMEDKFAVIYVVYTDDNGTHYYYGDIVQYGIERFAQRQVVDYSSADIGGKGKTVSSDDYNNEQYVNMMLRILEAYKASEALEELRAPKN